MPITIIGSTGMARVRCSTLLSGTNFLVATRAAEKGEHESTLAAVPALPSDRPENGDYACAGDRLVTEARYEDAVRALSLILISNAVISTLQGLLQSRVSPDRQISTHLLLDHITFMYSDIANS